MTPRILIVDDEPAIVLSIEFLLQNAGYQTAVARNGCEALREAASFLPQLVVLDVMLPEVDGFEVCRQLRADPIHAGVKILLLSARGRAEEMERGTRLGAHSYMTKPFATRDLVASVRALLSGEAA